jgi:class 3 adenylate cyclase
MLNRLITKFEQADGRSEFVIAVVVDIRNFSTFSRNHEAPDIAMFIKKFYSTLLKNYFTEAVYAKPTGDGLMMLFKYSEKTLAKVSEHVISNCLEAVNDFPKMLADDPMLNYQIPERIGFGVARGTAFCLYAGREIIDYSGQVLNLASRLNDLARPKGVVIDGAYLNDAIPENLRSQFQEEDCVYIRGIYESTPTKIFHSKSVTIDSSVKHPIAEVEWKKVEHTIKYGDLKKITFNNYLLTLHSEALSPNEIKAQVKWPIKKPKDHSKFAPLGKVKYRCDANGPQVELSVEEIRQTLNGETLAGTAVIIFEIQYVPKEKNNAPRN